MDESGDLNEEDDPLMSCPCKEPAVQVVHKDIEPAGAKLVKVLLFSDHGEGQTRCFIANPLSGLAVSIRPPPFIGEDLHIRLCVFRT